MNNINELKRVANYTIISEINGNKIMAIKEKESGSGRIRFCFSYQDKDGKIYSPVYKDGSKCKATSTKWSENMLNNWDIDASLDQCNEFYEEFWKKIDVIIKIEQGESVNGMEFLKALEEYITKGEDILKEPKLVCEEKRIWIETSSFDELLKSMELQDMTSKKDMRKQLKQLGALEINKGSLYAKKKKVESKVHSCYCIKRDMFKGLKGGVNNGCE